MPSSSAGSYGRTGDDLGRRRRRRAGRGGRSGRAAVAPGARAGVTCHFSPRTGTAPRARRSSGVSVRSSRGSMRATVPPRWARTVAAGRARRASTSSVTSRAPRATIRPANVVLPAPERAEEGDGAACERHGAGVQHVHAAQHRRQRQHLGEDEALPAPRRSGRRRGDDAPAVGRDEVAAVARRPHAEADLVVALARRARRCPSTSRRSSSVRGRLRRAGRPARGCARAGVGTRPLRSHDARARAARVSPKARPTTNRRAAGDARSAAKVGRRGRCPPAR